MRAEETREEPSVSDGPAPDAPLWDGDYPAQAVEHLETQHAHALDLIAKAHNDALSALGRAYAKAGRPGGGDGD